MKISDEAVLLRGAVVSGDVTLEAGVSVWYNSVLRGDLAPIVIGKNSNVQENAVLHIDYDKPCILGEGVTVGHGAILHGCTVGDNTVVGMGAILLSGAQVGRDCIIGAGSLVTGKTVVPDGMLVLGSPARVIRPLTEEEIAHNRENASVYVTLSQKEKAAAVRFG